MPSPVPQAAVIDTSSSRLTWAITSCAAGLIGIAAVGGVLLASANKRLSAEQTARTTAEEKQASELAAANERLDAVQKNLDARIRAEKKQAAEQAKQAAELAKQKQELGSLESDLKDKVTEQKAIATRLRKAESNVRVLEADINAEKSLRDAAIKAATEESAEKVKMHEARLVKLEDEMQQRIAERQEVQEAFDAARDAISELQGKIDTLNSEVFDPQGLWDTLAELQRSQAQNWKTVAAEDRSGGWRIEFRLDTRDGTTFGSVYDNANSLQFRDYVLEGGFLTPEAGVEAGRYEVKVTFSNDGDVYDVVRLDTKTGRVWNFYPYPTPSSWRSIYNGYRRDGKNAWRMDVDPSSGAGLFPRVVVTHTETGFAYESSGPSNRDYFIPLQ